MVGHPLVIEYQKALSQRLGQLVMNYHPLGDFNTVWRRLDRSFSSDELWAVFDQGVKATTFVHVKCVIHNDVKGANILLDTDGRIRFTDFGAPFTQCAVGQRFCYCSDDRLCSHLPPARGKFWLHILALAGLVQSGIENLQPRIRLLPLPEESETQR